MYCILAFTSLHRHMPLSPPRLLPDIESVASHSVGYTHLMCSRGRGVRQSISTNNAAVTILTHGPFGTHVTVSLGCIPMGKIAGSQGLWIYNSTKFCPTAPAWLHPSSPTYTGHQIHFPHISATPGIIHLSNFLPV